MKLRLFPNHTGIWEGTYIRIDAKGIKQDEWKSRLTIRIIGEDKYHQVNEYFWADGYTECHDFGISSFNEKGELIFDNPRILGKAWETEDSVCLIWSYLDRPGSKLFEMIDLIGDGNHRVRNWRWTLDDEFQGITMIEERKTGSSHDIDPSFWEGLAARRTLTPSKSNFY